VTLNKLDGYMSNSNIHFDRQTETMFVTTQDSKICEFFKFSDSKGYPAFKFIDNFKIPNQSQNLTFLSNRNVDAAENEIAKALRLCDTYAEFLSFKVPLQFGQVD